MDEMSVFDNQHPLPKNARTVTVKFRFVGKGKPLPYETCHEDNKSQK